MTFVTRAFLIFAAIQCALAVARWQLWTFGTDTGLFAQVIAHAGSGFVDGPEAASHFSFHWSPIIALLYPLVVATQGPLGIQLAEVLIVGATAFPLYAFVRAHASERLARFAALLSLLYPPLASIAFEEFHELAFYPVLAVCAMLAADRRAWGWFTLAALGLVTVREDAAIVSAGTGVALIIWGMRRPSDRPGLDENLRGSRAVVAAGASLVALCAVTLAFYYAVVIPHVGMWQPSHFYAYPQALGPLGVLAQIPLVPRLTYCLEAFAPLLFLPLLSEWTLVALPAFVMILLANDGVVWRMGGHYAALWIPWLLLGTADALVRKERSGGGVLVTRLSRGVIAVCVLVLLVFDPAHPAHYLGMKIPGRADVARAFALVPTDATVCTHSEWFTHVAYRYPHATPYLKSPCAYVVVAADYPSDQYRDEVLPQIASGALAHVTRIGDVDVYRRMPAGVTTLPRSH